ncbi:MAG: MFS transporter [Verrucomicrobia bacterium]|nr:MFS transporter [Verrucomicrobiota bacterium]
MVRPRLLTILCYGAMMSLAIGVNLLPIFLTSFSASFGGANGLSQEQLGRLGAFSFAGLVIGILLAGPLADRWGAKIFAIAGNAVMAAGLVGMSIAPDYWALSLAVFWLGFGAGVLDMVLSPVVSVLNPEQRSAAMNWLHSFYCVGAVITILAGTVALQAGVGWRNASLLLLPLPVVLLVTFGFLHFPELVHESEEAGRSPIRELLREPWLWGCLIAIFLGGATELGMAQWLPAYAETSLGFPKWIGGTALLAFSVLMAAGRMVVGSIGTRVNPFVVLAWCCGSSVLLFLLGSFLMVPGWALTACVAVGFTGSALWPTVLAVAADRYPAGGATMFAALAAMGNAGGILMPWIVGWIGDLVNLHWGLAVSTLAPLLMLPLVLVLKSSRL